MTEREIYEWVLDQIANYKTDMQKPSHYIGEKAGIIKGLKLVKSLIEDYGDLEEGETTGADQERAALLAWLDELIVMVDKKHTEALIVNHFLGANYWAGQLKGYRIVKAHIESETKCCIECARPIQGNDIYPNQDNQPLCEDCWREAGEPIPGVPHDEA